MEEIKNKMINILRQNGIIVFEENEVIEMNSLMFISLIVNIEEEFEIEVPDDYLNLNQLNCLSDFVKLIISIKIQTSM